MYSDKIKLIMGYCMKNLRRLFLTFVIVLLAFSFCGCTKQEDVKVTSVELTDTEIVLKPSEVKVVGVSIYPNIATDKKWTIIGGNPAIATITPDVDNNKIIITATDEIGQEDSTFISVRATDGSYKEANLTIKISEDDLNVDTPSNLTFDGKKLVWQDVLEAEGYSVNINGQDYSVYNKNYFEINLEEYAGQQVVAKVKAKGKSNSLDSGYTPEVSFLVLNKPTNIAYNDKTSTISWNSVEGAVSYSVNINNKIFNATQSSLVVSNFLNMDGSFEIKVKANGNADGSIVNSAYSDVLQLTRLTSPKNFSITNGIARWDSVLGAKGYEVLYSYSQNGESKQSTQTILGTRFNLPFDVDAGTYFVRVRALGDGKNTISGDFGVENFWTKLDKVKNLRVQNGIVVWDIDSKATSYIITLQNVVTADDSLYTQTTDASIHSFAIENFPAGEYKVNVQVKGSDATIQSSLLDTPLAVTKLQTPQNLQAIKSDSTCTVQWTRVYGATSYLVKLVGNSTQQFYVQNSSNASISYSFNSAVIASNTNLISVQAIGSDATEQSITYINSEFCQEITIDKLSTPILDMSEISNGVVAWNMVSNAGGYEVAISSATGDLITTYSTSANKANLNDNIINNAELSAGSYIIKVRAVAKQNSLTFNGDYSETVKVNKLPSNFVKVQDGTIADLEPQGNYVYRYIVTQQGEKPRDIASINEYVEKTIKPGETIGIQVKTTSKGQDDDGTYYINSNPSQTIYVYKLPTITDAQMVNGMLSFGKMYNNISGFKFVLCLDGEDTDNATKTQKDYFNIEAGQHTVTIRAVATQSGSGVSYDESNPLNLNSYPSADFGFTKLFAPSSLRVSSFVSEEVTFDELLSSITNYSESSSGALIWSAVSGANGYQVVFEDNTAITTSKLFETFQNTAISAGTHTVCLKALGNGTDIITSANSEQNITFTKCVAPNNLSLLDGWLNWSYDNASDNPNANAKTDIYKDPSKLVVYLIIDANGNYYSTIDYDAVKNDLSLLGELLAESKCKLPTSLVGTNTIQLVAIPLNCYISDLANQKIKMQTGTFNISSDYSRDALNIESLATPLDLDMENNTIYWSPVRNNTTGLVAVKGYDLTFTVSVDNEEKQLTISFQQAESASIDVANKIVYVTDLSVKENCRWLFNKANFEQMFGEGAYKTGMYYVTVRAIAYNVSRIVNGRTIYYVNSDISTTKEIEVLKNPIIKLSRGILTWDGIANASGYWLYISKNADGLSSVDADHEVLESKALSFELGEYYEPTTYYFNIVARGDDKNTISSEFDTNNQKSFIKMQKITGLKIENGVIKYNQSDVVAGGDNKCGYALYIHNSKQQEDGIYSNQKYLSYELSDEDLFEGGLEYYIRVKAIGDDSKYLNSDLTDYCYVDDQKTVLPTKFAMPDNIQIKDGILVWDIVRGATSYKIDVSGGVIHKELVNTTVATSYNFSDVGSGSYRIILKVMGNNYYLNSSKYQIDKITKLSDLSTMSLKNGYLVWDYEENSNYHIIIDDKTDIELQNLEIISEYNDTQVVGKYVKYNLADLDASVHSIKLYNFGADVAISSAVTDAYIFEKLSVPQGVEVTEEKLRFNQVENAKNYAINFTLLLSGGYKKSITYIPNGLDSLTKQNNTYMIAFAKLKDMAVAQLELDVSKITSYKISVVALGDSIDVLSAGQAYFVASNASDEIDIVQTPSPTIYTDDKATFYGRILWDVAGGADYYKVYVKVEVPADASSEIQSQKQTRAVLTGYKYTPATDTEPNGYYTDDAHEGYVYYIVKSRDYANIMYPGETYSFVVIACKNKNGFDSEDSNVLSGLTYNLYASSQNGADAPYTISNSNDFANIKYNVDANYILTGNIELNDNLYKTSADDIIGTSSRPFNGTLDGNGKTISGIGGANLRVDYRNTNFGGLFGTIGEKGVVKNLKFNADISSVAVVERANGNVVQRTVEVAGIAQTNYGTIYNVEISGMVCSTYSQSTVKVYNAGITINNYGTISYCVSNTTVTPTNTQNSVYSAGIAVYNYGAIECTGFTGSASGQVVGGIVAFNYSSSQKFDSIKFSGTTYVGGTITQCYYESASQTGLTTQNKGTNANMAGGIVGNMAGGTITYCYSNGFVTGVTNSDKQVCVGGLIGYNEGGVVGNCYVVGYRNEKDASGKYVDKALINATSGGTSSSSAVVKAGVVIGFNEYGSASNGKIIFTQLTSQRPLGASSQALRDCTKVDDIQNSIVVSGLNNTSCFDTTKTYPTLKNAKYRG